MMKKLITILLILFSISLFAQDDVEFDFNLHIKGDLIVDDSLFYGDSDIPYILDVDSIVSDGNDVKIYDGLDTVPTYTPVADRVVIGDVALLKEIEFNAQTGTSYTLALTDAAKLITLSNAGAITLTVPTNAAVAFPVGTQITIVWLGVGQVTVTGAGPPTINSADGDLKLRVRYSSATLIKTATDVWLLVGDIDA